MSYSELEDVATSLSAASHHFRAASEALCRAVDATLRAIDTSSAASNRGDNSFPNSVLWSELARAGIEVRAKQLGNFARHFATDLAPLLLETSQVAGAMGDAVQRSGGVTTESLRNSKEKFEAAAGMQAATVCTVLSNLFHAAGDLAKKFKDVNTDIVQLRSAKPHLVNFCSSSFGEFHRQLLAGPQPVSSVSSFAPSPSAARAESVATTRRQQQQAAPPPLAPVAVGGAAATPTLLNAPDREQDDNSAAVGGKRKGKRVVRKKRRGGSADGGSQQVGAGGADDNSEIGHTPLRGGSAAASLHSPDFVEQQQQPQQAKSSKAQQQQQQQSSSSSAAALANVDDDLTSNRSFALPAPKLLNLGDFIRYGGGGNIEPILPITARTRLHGQFTAFATLLSKNRLDSEAAQAQIPAALDGDSEAPLKRIVQQCFTDISLDAEIGGELDLMTQDQQQRNAVEWDVLVSSPPGGGGAASAAFKQLALRNGGKWSSLFALLRDNDGIFAVRQDSFKMPGNSNSNSVEVALALRVPPTSATTLQFSAAVNSPSGDPVGFAFVRIMRELVRATATTLVNEAKRAGGGGGPSPRGAAAAASKKQEDDLLSMGTNKRSREHREQLDAREAELRKQKELELQKQQSEQGIVRGVVSFVANTVVSVAKAPVNLVGSVAGAVVDTAGDAVRGQQLAMFRRNFPELKHMEVDDLFNCALSEDGKILRQGVLYLLEDRCAFCASLMDAKFVLEWRDVKALERKKLGGIVDNSIEVSTFGGDHFFLTSFLNREAALKAIFASWTRRS